MKKLFKGIIALVLSFTSLLAVAGCGNGDGDKNDPTVITKEEWEAAINYDLFSVKTMVDITPEDEMMGSCEINFDISNGYEFNYNNIFYPDSEGGGSVPDVCYLNNGAEKFTYKYNSTTMNWYWEHELDVQEEYNANISDIRELVWRVKVGYSKFTQSKGTSVYTMAVSGSSVEDIIPGVKEVMGVTAFSIDKVSVVRTYNNEYIIWLNSDSDGSIISISFHDVSAIDWVIDNEISRYTGEYKLVNNSNDVNQITLEVDATGFHIVSAYEEAYYRNDNGTYYQYYKNGESYQVTEIREDQYDMIYKQFVTAHTYLWSKLALGNFKKIDGKYVYGYDVAVTDTGTKYEYYFSNIVIDPEAGVATWDYMVHDKSLNQDSPVYQIVVTPIYSALTYPTVD